MRATFLFTSLSALLLATSFAAAECESGSVDDKLRCFSNTVRELTGKVEALNGKHESLESKSTTSAGKSEALSAKLDALSAKYDALNTRHEALVAKYDALSAKFNALAATAIKAGQTVTIRPDQAAAGCLTYEAPSGSTGGQVTSHPGCVFNVKWVLQP